MNDNVLAAKELLNMAALGKILVAPSILSGDFANMEESVKLAESWGADLIHCDVMDGVYVNNITFGMPMVKAIKRFAKLPLDVHLMITKPEKYVERFVDSGADIVTFHPDASENAEKTLDLIKNKGALAGLVFNPNIEIEPYIHLLKKCDIVLVMSVYAGYGGQSFIAETLKKVALATEYCKNNNLNIPIEIDGGINKETSKLAKKEGVSILVAGNSIYSSSDPKKTVSELRT